jgi:hypothetical protein
MGPLFNGVMIVSTEPFYQNIWPQQLGFENSEEFEVVVNSGLPNLNIRGTKKDRLCLENP